MTSKLVKKIYSLADLRNSNALVNNKIKCIIPNYGTVSKGSFLCSCC